MVLGIVKLITWKVKVDQQSYLGDREEGTQGGKKTPTKSSMEMEPAHRFDPCDVKPTGCHICGHKDINLFILKAPGNCHKKMFIRTPSPSNALQEPEPAERTQIHLESSSRVQTITAGTDPKRQPIDTYTPPWSIKCSRYRFVNTPYAVTPIAVKVWETQS